MNKVKIWFLLGCFGILIISTNGCKKEDDSDDEDPVIEYDKVSDIEGNLYKTVKIGNQWWMAKNLRTRKYNDDEEIPLIDDENEWFNLDSPGYCWYDNNDLAYKDAYGALYNWYTIKTDKLCPAGWHVPSDDEWTILMDFLGGADEAGGKLKEEGTAHWESPNSLATNKSGFTAVPGGIREISGAFDGMKLYGFWWSSTEYSDEHAMFNGLAYNSGMNFLSYSYKNCGFAVRCVKD